MRRRHDEYVAVPLTRREAAPRVKRVRRWTRTPIHPDGGFLLLLIQVPMKRNDLLRGLVDVGPDPQRGKRAFERVVPRVRPAGPFGDVEVLGRPALQTPACRVADRNTRNVSRHPTAILVARQR